MTTTPDEIEHMTWVYDGRAECECGWFRARTADRVHTTFELERWGWEHQIGIEAGGQPIICFDFDDTLTANGGIDAAVQLRREGYGIVVCTANADVTGVRAWIRERWPDDLTRPPVTDRKPQAACFVDDKAVRFRGDWNAVLDTIRRVAQ